VQIIEDLSRMKASVSKNADLDVVVCVKNRAETLERVLRQIVREIPFRDLIVIYGTSNDETKEIAEKYTNKVFWDGDRGLGAARNLGIRKACSGLVAMIDSDIVLTKGWYESLIKHFEDPEVAAAMGTTIYGYGILTIQRLWEYWQRTDPEGWGCTNTVFKRDYVLKIGNFDESIRGAGEDRDLYRRILAAGYKWVWDREVVVYHPMSLLEYLNHTSWWEESAPQMHDLIVQVRTYSLFRIYCRLVYALLKSIEAGARLSRVVHPTMLFYIPMLGAVSFRAQIKGLKKTLSS
jgi:glycosyltransferase involved in cell wall biosynthesis